MLKKNSHCSFCGHAFADDAAWPRTCSQCKNTSYINPLPVAVTVLPVQSDAGIGVLCVRRTIEPRRGQLALPGGYIEMGESWQAACVRELREEAEIEIDAATITLFAAHSAPDGTGAHLWAGTCHKPTATRSISGNIRSQRTGDLNRANRDRLPAAQQSIAQIF